MAKNDWMAENDWDWTEESVYSFSDKPVSAQQSDNKYYCEYCHQMSFDDSRGGCKACGAPRQRVRISKESTYGCAVWA